MPASKCRFCAAPLEHVFADLGMSPLANSYVPAEREAAMEPFYPLRAYVCERCRLVQLEEFQAPERIFSDYAYLSSYSSTWLEHSRRYAEDAVKRFSLDASSLVVEVASNDGYLLKYFRERNIPVLGIEPAANVAELAEQKGIPTLVEFFGTRVARELAQRSPADLLIGNNVLAHVPDLNDFVAGMKLALKPAGVITMEFPHLLRLISDAQWDTIYHEHFSYFSFTTAREVFARHGLQLFDVQELSTHGGSLRVFGCHRGAREDGAAVAELLDRERGAGLLELDTYRQFEQRVREDKLEILSTLIDLHREGQRLAAYGAPAKGNTLLNYCGIGPELVPYTCDLNPHKQGHYLPGTHIPIREPGAIDRDRPDIVFILPWNLRDEIIQQLSAVREWGGRFLARAPQLTLV